MDYSCGVSVSLRSAPKPDGSKRPLGIPTVLDRVIQQAVAQVLGPLFEAGFNEHNHGYRPGRSAKQAVAAMENGWKEGRRRAVECDLKSFFDTVMATRSRKGCWRMSQNELVRIALNNRWLEEHGVPDMRAIWIVSYYGQKARV